MDLNFKVIEDKYLPALRTFNGHKGQYGFTDDELYALLDFYNRLERYLFLMGDEYKLVWKDVISKLHELDSFVFHRKNK